MSMGDFAMTNAAHGEAEEYRALICELPGVMHAQCPVNAQGYPVEIHVISDTERAPKQLARDIQSAMMAKFNIKIDHRIISIAQIDAPETQMQPLPEPVLPELRPMYTRVSVTSHRDTVAAEITLSNAQTLCVGKAEGDSSVRGRLSAIARATLDALHHLIEREDMFRIVDVRSVAMGEDKAVLVLMTCQGGGRNEMLLGAALDRDDINTAAVKAALDAVNRRMALLK